MSHPQLTPRRRAALEAVAAGGVTVAGSGHYRNRGGDSVSQAAMKWLLSKHFIDRAPADWGAYSGPVSITDAGTEALKAAQQAEEEPL